LSERAAAVGFEGGWEGGEKIMGKTAGAEAAAVGDGGGMSA